MKRVLGVAIILFLVLELTWPVMTAADSSGTVVITGSIVPTISSVSPSSGVQGNTYSNVVIIGNDFTGASSISFGTDIAVSSFSVNSATEITANILISSGATAGARDVSVTVAGVTGTKTSAFTVVASSFSITAPSGISLGNMTRGQTATGHSSTPGSVATNAGSWQVVAKDANTGGNAGYMLKGGSTHLASQLRIGKTSNSCNTNAGDSVGLVYTQADGSSLPFYTEQDVDSNDAVGAYSITIAFTGSPQ